MSRPHAPVTCGEPTSAGWRWKARSTVCRASRRCVPLLAINSEDRNWGWMGRVVVHAVLAVAAEVVLSETVAGWWWCGGRVCTGRTAERPRKSASKCKGERRGLAQSWLERPCVKQGQLAMRHGKAHTQPCLPKQQRLLHIHFLFSCRHQRFRVSLTPVHGFLAFHAYPERCHT